ncbi:zona pellucida sperm-binding protein 3-like [Candoia aspera]|uniref:zona pellucida sperm-binding protein 3-like n=1 Tax=Candoia aspera TaxID=51853 RepID=UPI002FD8108A
MAGPKQPHCQSLLAGLTLCWPAMDPWLLLPVVALLQRGYSGQLWPPVGPPYAPLPEAAAPPAVQVQCEPHRMVVTVRRDLFGAGRLVEPTELALGAAACPPVHPDAGAGVVVFEAGLHECGSVVQMTPDLLIYQTSLFYRPSLANHPVIVRSSGATIGLECHYPRTDNLSSKAIQPTWFPFGSSVLAEAKLGFSLRLMNDDWTAERASTHFQLGQPMYLQADVQAEGHLPLRLWVESCIAGLSPMPTSGPQHAIMGSSGCLLDGREEGVSSTFLSPRPHQETLQFTVDAFQFAGEAQKLIYITCHLKVTPAEQAPDALNKACSFDAASHSWLPVEGPPVICSCCEAESCDGTVEAQGFNSGEMSWQQSLSAETAAPEAALALGPLFVLDPQGSVDQFPGEPGTKEETVMEEFIPAAPNVTQSPLKEQEGSTEVSGDLKDRLGLPLGGLVQQGPIFLNGAEDGSGAGDQAKAATERSTLEIRAEVLSRPLEDVAAFTAAKLPKGVVNMVAKGGERPSGGLQGWPLLLTGAAAVAPLPLAAWLLVRRRRRLRLAAPASLAL